MSALAEATPTTMPEPIVFTDSAAAKVADLIAEEGNTDLKLRVSPLMRSPMKTTPPCPKMACLC